MTPKIKTTQEMMVRSRSKSFSLALLATCAISPSYSAVMSYNWTVSDSAADWGANYNPQTGNYAHSTDVSGQSNSTGSWSLPFNEGPVDGTSGLILFQPGVVGVHTRTAVASTFDLSTVGSSVTTRFAYHFMDKFSDTGDPFHLFEMGLTNNSTYAGGAGDESLVMAASLDLPFAQNGPATYDLNLYDSAGLGASPSSGWSVGAPLASMGTDYDLDALANVGGQLGTHSPGLSTAVVSTWTNVGNGQLTVDYQVFTLAVTGPAASDTVTGVIPSAPGSVTVNHGFSDLSGLMPSMGYRTGGSEIPTSGGAFDWNSEYEAAVPPAPAPIPEPSSILALCGLLFSGLMIRRR